MVKLGPSTLTVNERKDVSARRAIGEELIGPGTVFIDLKFSNRPRAIAP